MDMKRFEQIVLRFRMVDIESSSNSSILQKALSEKGNEGFRLINTFLHGDMNKGKPEILMCIMEREL
jgi:hypothetical protein